MTSGNDTITRANKKDYFIGHTCHKQNKRKKRSKVKAKLRCRF